VTHRRFAIAGEYFDSDATLLKCGDSSGSIRTQPLPYRKDVTRFAMTEGDDGCFWVPAQDIVGELIRAAERWPA
jgi:hypothetical protein